MKLNVLTLCLVTVVVLSAQSLQAQFHNLGLGNAITGLSDDGSVGTGTNFSEYFVWTTTTGVQGIGGLIPGNGVGGQAKISGDGTKISGTSMNPANNHAEMSRYDTVSGAWTPLGDIGGLCPSSVDEASSGWGISGDGNSVVGLGWTGVCGPAHAIQWTNPGPTNDLGSTVMDRSSRANGTNANGSVVVGWQDASDGFRQGAVWNMGVQTLLTNAMAEPLSEAQDVNPTGEWVVGDGGFASLDQAWRWNAASGMEPLGMLNPSGFFPRGSATAISDDGSVIVGYERELGSFPTGGAGFIWTAATGMLNLNDFLDSLNIDRQGFNASLPLSISGDGKTIGGAGVAPGSLFGGEGFVVTIPEPAAATILGILAIGIVSVRRRVAKN